MDYLAKAVGKITPIVGTSIIVIFVVAIIFALPTLFLWNWLMPTIFGLTKITLWQALGLNLLAGFLLGHSSTFKKD